MVETGARHSEVVGDGFRFAAVLVEREEPLTPRQHQSMFILRNEKVYAPTEILAAGCR